MIAVMIDTIWNKCITTIVVTTTTQWRRWRAVGASGGGGGETFRYLRLIRKTQLQNNI